MPMPALASDPLEYTECLSTALDHMTSVAPNPTGDGYWVQAGTGGTWHGAGDTQAFNDAPLLGLVSTAQGLIRATPDGEGYYVVESDTGIIHSVGAAPTLDKWKGPHGIDYEPRQCPDPAKNTLSGIAVTPSGDGLWAVDQTGIVWATGDAELFGSPYGELDSDWITGLTATPTGKGYTLITNSGRMYAYGDALYIDPKTNGFTGEASGIAMTLTGQGYWVINTQGVVWAYGDACGVENCGTPIHDGPPIISGSGTEVYTDIAAAQGGQGFVAIEQDGTTSIYGAAPLATPIDVSTLAGETVRVAPQMRSIDLQEFERLSFVAEPSHGTVSYEDGAIAYTPDEGFVGVDQFTFSITGSSWVPSAPVPATVTVQPAAGIAPSWVSHQPPGSAQIGTTFTYQFAAAGEPAPTYTVEILGESPRAEFSIHPVTGLLTYPIADSQPITYRVTATNSVGSVTTEVLRLQVTPAGGVTPPESGDGSEAPRAGSGTSLKQLAATGGGELVPILGTGVVAAVLGAGLVTVQRLRRRRVG